MNVFFDLNKEPKNIHIVGIAGTMTSAIAVELKSKGYHITGSDQPQIYPPISTILEKNKIPFNVLISKEKIDLAIIGSSYLSFSNTREEFEFIKKSKIPYVSATEFIGRYVSKSKSILIAGTYGKTTITSIVSWIFAAANLNPSTMFGGDPVNSLPPLKINDSMWSIIEADESVHGLDKKAKFLYYPVKYLLITSADWEHKDCYLTRQDNFDAFKKLVEKVSDNGLLVINSQGIDTDKLSRYTKAKVIRYGKNSSYFIQKESVRITEDYTYFTIKTPLADIDLKTTLLGDFNLENILAAVSLCLELGVDPKVIQKAISSYKGVKRRTQMVSNYQGIIFFDDFAQSAIRIESTIKAVKSKYPDKHLIVYFSPHATYLQNKKGIIGLGAAFKPADKVIIGKINFCQNLDKNKRTTFKDFYDEIGNKAAYFPLENDAFDYFSQHLKPGDIFLNISSGGYLNLKTMKKIINFFKK